MQQQLSESINFVDHYTDIDIKNCNLGVRRCRLRGSRSPSVRRTGIQAGVLGTNLLSASVLSTEGLCP